jgi:hypothetical protein
LPDSGLVHETFELEPGRESFPEFPSFETPLLKTGPSTEESLAEGLPTPAIVSYVPDLERVTNLRTKRYKSDTTIKLSKE